MSGLCGDALTSVTVDGSHPTCTLPAGHDPVNVHSDGSVTWRRDSDGTTVMSGWLG